MQKELEKIGLTEQESIVYLELLKEKYQKASDVAKKTNINRSVAYTVVGSLAQKGLVSYVIRNNTKYFSAASPQTLMDFLKDKEKDLQKILPKLENINPEKKAEISVELYEGKKGAITVLKDILRMGKDYVAIGEDGSLEKEVPLELKQYIRQLNEKKIGERILAKKGVRLLLGKRSEVRYLPNEFEIPTITTIYGDKVVIAVVKKPYYCVLIKSKELAESYRNFFEILWEIAAP